jgi:hypothetical protein
MSGYEFLPLGPHRAIIGHTVRDQIYRLIDGAIAALPERMRSKATVDRQMLFGILLRQMIEDGITWPESIDLAAREVP